MADVTDERIKTALRKGEDAFWAAVAREFPDTTTGDLDTGIVISLTQIMERAIRAWVDYNVTPQGNGPC